MRVGKPIQCLLFNKYKIAEIDVKKADLQRFPTTPVEFSEEQLTDIEKMLDKIEDDDDIQQVFTNIA